MSEQNWQKIVRRMTEISDAPLFIDDWVVPAARPV
jgi:replicative DNA helicase